jgi:hypothetical protein
VYTCVPGDKDFDYNWEDPAENCDTTTIGDMGWTLNSWVDDCSGIYPWNVSFLSIDLSGGIADGDEISTGLLSPVLEFKACTSLDISFNYGYINNYTTCSPRASLKLQCYDGTAWVDLWEELEPVDQYVKAQDVTADITTDKCNSEQAQFRFVVDNMCASSMDTWGIREFHVSGTDQ